MESFNRLCEVENCSKVATVFGLRVSLKERSCSDHMHLLTEKKMQICSIEGYHFISTLQDAVLFEDRSCSVEKGRGNLSALESSCNNELTEAVQAIELAKQKAIKAVEFRFEEMKTVATGVCRETMTQLAKVEAEFELFLRSKEYQLSPGVLMICGDLKEQPRFLRFGVADVSDGIAAALSDSWTVAAADIHSALKCLDPSQKKEAIQCALAEAAESAKKGIPEAVHFAELLVGEAVEFGEAKGKVVLELLELERNRNERDSKRLQHSWDLRQQYEFSDQWTVEVGQQLASLFLHQFGRFSEAEQILRECCSTAKRQNPLSEHSMQLSNGICEVYFTSGQYEKAAESGRTVLQTWKTANLPAEHYWITLFYAVSSMGESAKDCEASSLLEEWQKRVPPKDSKLAEMLHFLTCEAGVDTDSSPQRAREWLLQAKRIGVCHFPTSPFTAFALLRLALRSDRSAQEQYLQQAKSIYDFVDPMSTQAANTLVNLGTSLRYSNRLGEVEECYQRTYSICKLTGAKCIEVGLCFVALGEIYACKDKRTEAERCYRQAHAIFQVEDPKSVHAANNLFNLGDLLKNNQQFADAKECYRQVQAIYAEISPKSTRAADSLISLGNLQKESKCLGEAEECYHQAQAMYQVVDPKCTRAAVNFIYLGDLYRGGELWSAAERCYTQALANFGDADSKSGFEALAYFGLGSVFEAKDQPAQASDYYQKAAQIFARIGYTDMKSKAEDAVARLRPSECIVT